MSRKDGKKSRNRFATGDSWKYDQNRNREIVEYAELSKTGKIAIEFLYKVRYHDGMETLESFPKQVSGSAGSKIGGKTNEKADRNAAGSRHGDRSGCLRR
ncbi:MAG: hypothetical protein PUD80_01665 [Firmicutes bacterium]|nr:hypothetical protein [Bacillota bacterium]